MMQYAVMTVVLALALRGLWDVSMWLNKHLPTWGKAAVGVLALVVITWGMCI